MGLATNVKHQKYDPTTLYVLHQLTMAATYPLPYNKHLEAFIPMVKLVIPNTSRKLASTMFVVLNLYEIPDDDEDLPIPFTFPKFDINLRAELSEGSLAK